MRKKRRELARGATLSMPDLDISHMIEEVNNGDMRRMLIKVPESVHTFIEKYNRHRVRAGHKKVTKEVAILHLLYLGQTCVTFYD